MEREEEEGRGKGGQSGRRTISARTGKVILKNFLCQKNDKDSDRSNAFNFLLNLCGKQQQNAQATATTKIVAATTTTVKIVA